MFAETALVPTRMHVGELFDAVVQRLQVPYVWCIVAISGVNIAVFLCSGIP